jgi:HNH endonuclease
LSMDETAFIEAALGHSANAWAPDSLNELARQNIPDSILGHKRAILRADIHHLWARWFVQGLVDPQRYLNWSSSFYSDLFSTALMAVEKNFPTSTKPSQMELARVVARSVKSWVHRTKTIEKRSTLSQRDRENLLQTSGNRPHCWICGAAFRDEAIDNFENSERFEIPLPEFVDVLRPRGLIARDLRIEIDHVMPHSTGGGDGPNLRLACGWCNRHKGPFTSIYDVSDSTRPAKCNKYGVRSLPSPFWSVRVLALVNKCEYSGGCSHTTEIGPLTIALRNDSGSPNPTNLTVTCDSHDDFRVSRYVTIPVAKSLWGR